MSRYQRRAGNIDGVPIVPPNTPAEFNVGRSGCETPDTISLNACSLKDAVGQVFTVAISGAPCSGKTTLALFLAAIFSEGAEEEYENAETEISESS